MPKKNHTFRLPDEALVNLDAYMQSHSFKTRTEALEQILLHLLSPSASLTASSNMVKDDQKSSASDSLPCKQRITIDQVTYCINPATERHKVKITEIPDPAVCQACQYINKDLKGQTITEPPELTTTEIIREKIHDPNCKEATKDGMIWCPEGQWVFPKKCERCKTSFFKAWYDCQVEKLKKKGETLRGQIGPTSTSST
jgi:hypothetical protein